MTLESLPDQVKALCSIYPSNNEILRFMSSISVVLTRGPTFVPRSCGSYISARVAAPIARKALVLDLWYISDPAFVHRTQRMQTPLPECTENLLHFTPHRFRKVHHRNHGHLQPNGRAHCNHDRGNSNKDQRKEVDKLFHDVVRYWHHEDAEEKSRLSSLNLAYCTPRNGHEALHKGK